MEGPKRAASKERILDAAYHIAKTHGLDAMIRSRVAKQAGVSDAHVSTAFKGMDGLLAQVISRAIVTKNPRILIGAIDKRHPLVADLNTAAMIRSLMEAVK
jgi:AcrR family transcriptional regulator